MPEQEARGRAVYDIESEEPRQGGRRRRQVADWGVGEDVFDRLPSRRFTRAESAHARPSRPRRDVPRGGADDGRPTIVIGEVHEAQDAGFDEAPAGEWTPPVIDERRTVTITGRPDRMPAPRRRPPRTRAERVGHRPDRVVAWAVALGLLLILVAVATAKAAPLPARAAVSRAAPAAPARLAAPEAHAPARLR
jgi:hypothetical protein